MVGRVVVLHKANIMTAFMDAVINGNDEAKCKFICLKRMEKSNVRFLFFILIGGENVYIF